MTETQNGHIFLPSGCLKRETMQEYQKGGFSSKIRQDITAHINKCSFCHEALEGLALIPNSLEQETVINSMKLDIDTNIRNRKSNSIKRFNTREKYGIIAVAASILLLAGVFFIYNYSIKQDSELIAVESVSLDSSKEKAFSEFPANRYTPSDEPLKTDQDKPKITSKAKMKPRVKNHDKISSVPVPETEKKSLAGNVETQINTAEALRIYSETDSSVEDLDIKQTEATNLSYAEAEISSPAIASSGKRKKVSIREVSSTRSQPALKSNEDKVIVGGVEAVTLPEFINEKYKDFDDYIKANLKYPASALSGGIEGEVTVEFYVTLEGNIKNAKVIKGEDPEFNSEALRLIMNSPEWVPASYKGVETVHKMTWIIHFKITD
jgi:TonB family protein